jgi:hypothetical protein
MKTSFYFILFLFVLTSCTKNEDPILNITSSEWRLERLYITGGLVQLKIAGSTNADKVTINTYGDGLLSERDIELDSKKQFNADITISFSVTSVRSEEFVVSTVVKAYKKNEILQVTLTSDKLKY